jgi:flagellin
LRDLEANHDLQSQIADATASKVGNMVDVDIAREAAAFTAAQVREQIATQSLSIANDQPRLLLNLFR